MTSQVISTGDNYRIVEKENHLNEKLYFVQFGFHKIQLFKRKYYIGKKYLYKELDYWRYIFRDEQKQFDSLLIMDFGDGEPRPHNLNEYLHKACKSVDDAKSLIQEYKEYLVVERKKHQENKKKVEEDKAQEDLKKLTSYEKIINDY